MKTAHSTMQYPQPTSMNGLIGNIEEHLKRIVGATRSNNLSRSSRLSPSTYMEACYNASDRYRSEDRAKHYEFLDFIHRIRCAINAFASRMQAAACERTYLSALIDVMVLRPSAVLRGNYQVRLSAREAEEYVCLSASSCTAARRGLVEKGLISIEGDQVDLSPFIEALQPLFEPVKQEKKGAEKSVSLPKDQAPLPKNKDLPLTVNVPFKKETITMFGNEDLFSREAVKETIALSPKLQKAIEDLLGCDYRDAPDDEIVKVLRAAAINLLPVGYDNGRAWDRGIRHHGLRTLAILVAALESTGISHRGKWFWGLVKRETVDVSSNLRKLVSARDEKTNAQASAATAIVKREVRTATNERHAEICKIALSALDELKASGKVEADEYFWMTAPSKFQIKVEDNVVKIAIRQSTRNNDKSTLRIIAEAVAERVGYTKTIYYFGEFAGIDSLSAFR